MEELPGPVITDQQNFYVETKQEPDYVSTTTNFIPPKPPPARLRLLSLLGGMFFSLFPLCFGVSPAQPVIKCFG